MSRCARPLLDRREKASNAAMPIATSSFGGIGATTNYIATVEIHGDPAAGLAALGLAL